MNKDLLELGEYIFGNLGNLSSEDLENKKLAYAETIWMEYENSPVFSLELIKATQLVLSLWEEEKINKSFKKLWIKIPHLDIEDQELISLFILEYYGFFNINKITKILFIDHITNKEYSPTTKILLETLGYDQF